MVLYVDVGDYDETPMPVVARDLAYSLESSDWSDFAETSTSVPGLLCLKPLPTQDGAKVPCKLLQSERGYVMLVLPKTRMELSTLLLREQTSTSYRGSLGQTEQSLRGWWF